MKTVKEVALELDVSAVTVYNHLKKLDKELEGLVFKKQNVTHLTEAAIEKIKESLGLIEPPVVLEQNVGVYEIIDKITEQVSKNVTKEINNNIEDINNNINSKVSSLEEELKELKKQNELLIEIIEEERNKKRGFFNNLFKK